MVCWSDLINKAFPNINVVFKQTIHIYSTSDLVFLTWSHTDDLEARSVIDFASSGFSIQIMGWGGPVPPQWGGDTWGGQRLDGGGICA